MIIASYQSSIAHLAYNFFQEGRIEVLLNESEVQLLSFIYGVNPKKVQNQLQTVLNSFYNIDEDGDYTHEF